MSRRTGTHIVVAPPQVAAPARQAAPLPPGYAERSASYARALWRIASADVSSGNTIEMYSDGDETFDAMIALIDAASRSVELESYILRDDTTGHRFADALGRAAARGAAVRVLGDWIGMRGTSGSFLDGLRRAGAEVLVFNPPGFHRWLGLVPRDHRKLLVVDDTAAVTGGIGIGDEWRGVLLRRKSLPWRDRCVRIEGPAASDLRRTFDNMWRRASGQRPSRQERRTRRVGHNTDIDPGTAPAVVAAVVEGEPGRFRVGRAFHLQCAASERSIWLATAYFIPSLAEVDALIGAAREGVDVRLLLPRKNDHPWVHGYQRRYYRTLLAQGVRVWEWNGEMMHAKTSVVDGRWTRIGSTDFNPLGIAVNFELDLYLDDVNAGSRAEDLFLADLAMSREVVTAPRD
ncbi:MAG: phosphatidylserine/phosphatidylglycerophosphate/cardiolipin synthase family protein [Gemmatimonadaceae bacterium]|nr:phosphatidylserine/phosphatidylglycerophosphate/cardiolipin synthase family protein [Gemmatimonadaceae bacterium]